MKQSTLMKVAMLGTNRSSSLGPVPDKALLPVWQVLEAAADPAQSLLQAAAIEHLYLQAGTVPLRADLPTVCEPEKKPYVSTAAASAFDDLLRGSFSDLIGEWIRMAQQSGLIAKPRLLPALFDVGDKNPSMRSAISDIVGSRGRWLADHESKWSWLDASEEDLDDELWKTGTATQRRQWLQQKLKRDPELAAESIAVSWPGESPDSREVFTGLVAQCPHPAHEEWLQNHALSDRRQNIRRHAARTLMSIEESAFRQRSLARASTVLKVSKKLIAKNQLDCEPPTAFDPAWQQDGLKEKPPTGTGPRDYWLYQILSVIPLRDWQALVQHADPMTLKINSDWSETVLRAWQQSAMIYPDTVSVMPLLQRMVRDKNSSDNTSAILSIVSEMDKEDVADTLEELQLPQGQALDLLRRLLPPLCVDHHPKLQKIASDWVFTKAQPSKSEAIALASCCDSRSIDALLTKIGKAKELSSAAEEFARTLEYRQSYLKHFEISAEKND